MISSSINTHLYERESRVGCAFTKLFKDIVSSVFLVQGHWKIAFSVRFVVRSAISIEVIHESNSDV